MIRALVVAAALVACSSEPSKKQPAVIDEVTAKLRTVEPALVKLAADLSAVGSDCAKVAATLDAFGAAHGADFRALETLAAKLTAEQQARIVDEMSMKLITLDQTFKSIVQTCGRDPALLPALERAGFAPSRKKS